MTYLTYPTFFHKMETNLQLQDLAKVGTQLKINKNSVQNIQFFSEEKYKTLD